MPPMRSRLAYIFCRRLASERGVALIMALGVSIILGATVTSAVAYTSANSRHSERSKADQVAFSLAEAGMNNALAQLYASTSPSLEAALPVKGAPASKTVPGIGRTEWYGTLQGTVWTVVGLGYVPNPSPGLPEIVRRASTRVTLGSAAAGAGNPAIWNYVYADDASACTTIGNSSVVNIPLYVRGGLCLQNSAKVTGYAVQVGGKLTITGADASVGTLSTPVNEVHVAGGCSIDGVTYQTPCGPGQRVYATTSTSVPTGLSKPAADFDYWYANAAPGPKRPCTTGSVPGGFDNDTVRNNSRPTFDLTPSTAYSCRTYDGAGKLIGELTWRPISPDLPSAGWALRISGTIFVDGDVTMNANAIYVGKATLYASGRFTLGQEAKLCGIAGCTSSWAPATNLLAVVAGYSPGDSVTIANQAVFQGAIYAVGDYRETNNSTVWGPIIANRLFLQNSTMNYHVPIGTPLPGMPSPSGGDSLTLTNEAGSWSS
jgi:hypothetical protein